MKRIFCILLAALMVLSLAACTNKQAEAKAAAMVRQIEALGEITLQSRVAIEKAEKAYNKLDLETKELVTNYYDIIQAKAAYQQLRIERIQGRVQAAQEAFDESWNTWNLFYTLRDIIKDCHPDEEYIVKEAIARNEELCFDGTHFINFDHILAADKRYTRQEDREDIIVLNIDGTQYFSLWDAQYQPYTEREDGQSYYLLYFGTEGASTIWGKAVDDLNDHLGLYSEVETVLEDWGAPSKRGIKSMVYVDDIGSQLSFYNWRTGNNYYLEIYIKPAPEKVAQPAAN